MPADISKSMNLLIAILIGLAIGCEPTSNQDDSIDSNSGSGKLNASGTANQYRPEIDAPTILSSVTQRYERAKTYQDNGVLYLSYMLNGQRLDEPKRWATSYRDDGRLSLEVFNTRLRGDGDLLACEIFDIETANLDNQNLVVPYGKTSSQNRQPPLDQVIRDRIARHFVLGFSELPLAASYEKSGPWLLPPPAALLTGQVQSPWLTSPQKTQRLPDQLIDEKNCFVVRSLALGLTADIWIDQKSLAIKQMSLPLKLLADEVITSEEVSEVVLVAKFHDAVFDKSLETSQFEYSPRDEAVFVRKLVSLPEPLPSEQIGRTAPNFTLRTPAGETRSRNFFDQKTTVLVWLAGSKSTQTASTLKSLVTATDNDVVFGIVYSDSDTALPGSGKPTPSEAIEKLGANLQVPIYFDRQHTASSKLKVKSVPAALVLDGNAKVQYVQPLIGDDWQKKLAAAIVRVNEGDDVAGEMRESYAQYLDTYHQQLLSVGADSLVGQHLVNEKRPMQLASQAKTSSLKISPQRIWLNKDFKSPGNISAIEDASSSAKFVLLDGVQSTALIDQNGKLLKKETPMGLGPSQPITKLRVRSAREQTRLAVFSVMGSRHLILDKNLQTIQSSKDFQNESRIMDIQWDDKNDATTEFLVAWENDGVELSGEPGSPPRLLSSKNFESIANGAGVVAGIIEGKIHSISTHEPLVKSEIQFTQIVAGGSQFVGVGQDSHGKWSAIGFDASFHRLWSIETGPQLHENFLSPIASSERNDGERVWAIADSNQMVHLVAGNGQWLGEFQSENELTGICVSTISGQSWLTMCSKKGVECWNLNVTQNVAKRQNR